MLPFLIKKYGFSYAKASSLVMVSNLAGSLIQPVFGHIADRKDRPHLMIAGVMAAGAGMAATGLISGFAEICCAVIISGIGVAMFHPQGAQVINRISDRDNAGTNMGIFSFGGNLGFTLGPVSASAAIGTFGLGGTMLFVLPAIVFAVLMALVFKNGNEADRESISSEKHSCEGRQDSWGEFAKVSAVVITRSVVFSGIGTFMILFLADRFGIDETIGSALLSLYYGIQALSSLAGGKLSDILGFRRTLIISTAILTLSLFAFATAAAPVPAMIVMLPLGIGSSLGYSAMVSMGQLALPNHVGFASGITLGLSVSAGGIVVPLLGKIGDNYGLSMVYYILVIVSVLALLFSISVSSKKQLSADQ